MAIGNILKNFLCKLEWFSTLFPRIPVPIQQKLERKMNEKYPPPVPSARRTGSCGRSISKSRYTPEAESYSRSRSNHSGSREYNSMARDDRTSKHYSKHRSNSRDRHRERRSNRSRSPYIKNGYRSPSIENERHHERDRYHKARERRREEKKHYKNDKRKYSDDCEEVSIRR
ncbi:hypothetical protein PGB90_003514 [Kerria lacca]